MALRRKELFCTLARAVWASKAHTRRGSGRGGLCTGLNYGHFDAEWEVVYHREEFHGDREKMSGVTV